MNRTRKLHKVVISQFSRPQRAIYAAIVEDSRRLVRYGQADSALSPPAQPSSSSAVVQLSRRPAQPSSSSAVVQLSRRPALPPSSPKGQYIPMRRAARLSVRRRRRQLQNRHAHQPHMTPRVSHRHPTVGGVRRSRKSSAVSESRPPAAIRSASCVAARLTATASIPAGTSPAADLPTASADLPAVDLPTGPAGPPAALAGPPAALAGTAAAALAYAPTARAPRLSRATAPRSFPRLACVRPTAICARPFQRPRSPCGADFQAASSTSWA